MAIANGQNIISKHFLWEKSGEIVLHGPWPAYSALCFTLPTQPRPVIGIKTVGSDEGMCAAHSGASLSVPRYMRQVSAMLV